MKPDALMECFCIVTPSHRVLYDRFFLPTLDPSQFRVRAIELPQSGSGEFLADDFKAAIEFKLREIIRSIRENIANVIIWADVDIQFFGLAREHILGAFGPDTDLTIQKLNRHNDDVCGGFYAVRCSEKTAAFFERVLAVTQTRTAGNEQDALNLLLHAAPAPVKWVCFGPEFYARTHGLNIPRNAVLHHATCVLPSDHVRQKIELLSALEHYETWTPTRRYLYFLTQSLGALKRRLTAKRARRR